MRLFRHPQEVTPECRGATIALGNFDGVHLGHQAVIKHALAAAARDQGSAVGVVTFEPHPRAFFKPDLPPFRLTPFRVKMRLLQALDVNFVCCLAFDRNLANHTAEAFAAEILRDGLACAHVVVGEDFCFGKNRGGNAQSLKQMGQAMGFGVDAVSAAMDPVGAVYSSTLVRDRLVAGDPRGAVRVLGRPWEIEGRVEHGDQRGRLLGFPTANVVLGEFLHPKLGVYAVRAAIDEDQPHWIDGVANLGRRPTVGGERIQLEVHLFDFAGDLYGKHLRVALIDFIRPEIKFPGLDALKAQIAQDSALAKRLIAEYDGPMPGPLGPGPFVM